MNDELTALLRREMPAEGDAAPLADGFWDDLAARQAKVVEGWAMTEGEPGDPAAAIAQRIVARAFRERDAARKAGSEAERQRRIEALGEYRRRFDALLREYDALNGRYKVDAETLLSEIDRLRAELDGLKQQALKDERTRVQQQMWLSQNHAEIERLRTALQELNSAIWKHDPGWATFSPETARAALVLGK